MFNDDTFAQAAAEFPWLLAIVVALVAIVVGLVAP